MNRMIRTTLAALAPPRRQTTISVRTRLTTAAALIAALAWSPIIGKGAALLCYAIRKMNFRQSGAGWSVGVAVLSIDG